MSFDYQDREKDDTKLYLQAVEQGWPIKPEHLALAVQKVVAALAETTSPREVARLNAALARMYEQNMDLRYGRAAQVHVFAEGAIVGGGSAGRIEEMLRSVSLLPAQESIVEAKVVDEQPEFGAGIIPSCCCPAVPSLSEVRDV